MDTSNSRTQHLQTAIKDPNVKDKQYIVANYIENGIDYWVLQTGTKLSDVFHYLPAGIINKTETGIGATTLEFLSERNSIIVEPIKITASSKAYEHNALYIGSPTKYNSSRVTNKDIINYLNDGSIKHKKIVVVADSLHRIYNLLKEKQQDFFLMIDEADSVQLDSSFRRSMGNCIDIYKRFPKNRRALITATLLEFSDPELQDEPRTLIRFKKPSVRNIDLLFTGDVIGAALEQLNRLQQSFPMDKLLVAYNSVSGCYNLARHLVDENKISSKDVKILCGANSKDTAKEFYSELDSFILPGTINFITSAYFSGFDLKEDFHLISLSSLKNKVHCLSDHKLKQIAGRCRNTLLSETVIYSLSGAPTKTGLSKKDMVESARKELLALKCIEHNFSDNAILKANLKVVRDLIIANTTADSFQLVRRNLDDETVINYLNIDAYLESTRVMNQVYGDKNDLPLLLEKAHHKITQTYCIPKVKVIDHQIAKVVRQTDNKMIIDQLRQVKSKDDIQVLRSNSSLKASQINIINTFQSNWRYADKLQLLDKLEEAAKSPDSRKLNNTAFEIFFATLDKANIYKRNVNLYLEVGQTYQTEELLVRWNKIFTESGLRKKLKETNIASRITNIHFETKRNTKKQTYTIISAKLTLDIHKIRPEETTLMSLLELYVNPF